MRIRTFFPDLKLCWPAISKPVVLEKSDIPQKKALNSGNWKQFWNWKDFCHGRLQTGFSKSDAFSVRWAWPSIGWCPAQFFSWFKELYTRAFQWYIICFRILVGTCSKLQKHMNKNLGVSYSFSETVGPVSVFHTFIRFFMAVLCIIWRTNGLRTGTLLGIISDLHRVRINTGDPMDIRNDP